MFIYTILEEFGQYIDYKVVLPRFPNFENFRMKKTSATIVSEKLVYNTDLPTRIFLEISLHIFFKICYKNLIIFLGEKTKIGQRPNFNLIDKNNISEVLNGRKHCCFVFQTVFVRYHVNIFVTDVQ